jgi:hypothetical protein
MVAADSHVLVVQKREEIYFVFTLYAHSPKSPHVDSYEVGGKWIGSLAGSVAEVKQPRGCN